MHGWVPRKTMHLAPTCRSSLLMILLPVLLVGPVIVLCCALAFAFTGYNVYVLSKIKLCTLDASETTCLLERDYKEV